MDGIKMAKSLLDKKIEKMMLQFKLPKSHFKSFKRDVLSDYEDDELTENQLAKKINNRALVEIYDASFDNY